YRSDNGGSFVYINSTHANATSYLQANLNCGTAYSYRVTASNESGESAPAQRSEGRRAGEGGSVPNPPKNLRVSSVTENSIALVWEDDSTNEQHFDVYRSDNGGSFVYINSTHANATSYLQANLNCGTAYSYRITASNESGESAPAQ